MKIAVVYNRESTSVINIFGRPNQEKIGKKTIRRLVDALRTGGHRVIAVEGDKDLIDRLEEFMPRVLTGERPGMVFNVSYGIQGQARYTHVPSILEMVGVPYIASGPLAHSLCLDKVVTKMMLRQHGLPTPDFAVLDTPDAPIPELRFPLIVKPKNEAVSFGLRVVHDEAELREGVQVIFDRFSQPVLAEQYIDGREVNVGLLGNGPPEAFPPVELTFPGDGPAIYTYEDKTGRSGRTIEPVCPAPIGEELLEKAQDIARKAFVALGCADCARVDMRLDAEGNLYILEINSLPSLGEHGSYLVGAAQVGLDFTRFVNRLVEVASARYFGTPEPPAVAPRDADPGEQAFAFLTARRDQMEKRLRQWVELPSRTSDPVRIREAMRRLGKIMGEIGMKPVRDLADERVGGVWESDAGLDGGTLFIGHLDLPVEDGMQHVGFRREPETIRGEGVGSSRAPLVSLEFALRALRSQRRLRRTKVGVLYYTDEGRDCRYSAQLIRVAAARAARVVVLRPGSAEDALITRRRGHRTYRLRIHDSPHRPGQARRRPETFRWAAARLEEMAALGNKREGLSVSVRDLQTRAYPLRLPHEIEAGLLVTYLDPGRADRVEASLREILKRGPRWELELIADRPPMSDRGGSELLASLERVAGEWKIPFEVRSSVWPSAAGLVPDDVDVVCGAGPAAQDLCTPQEAVHRHSLMQRTLLLAQFLTAQSRADNGVRA